MDSIEVVNSLPSGQIMPEVEGLGSEPEDLGFQSKTDQEPILTSSFTTADLPTSTQNHPSDTFALQNDTTNQECVSSSESSSRHSDGAAGDIFLDNDDYYNDHSQLSTTSSRSSLSSIPASMIVRPIHGRQTMKGDRLPSTISSIIGTDFCVDEQEYESQNARSGAGVGKTTPAKKRMENCQNYPFRHPSSVRAMQMHTEDECDDDYDRYNRNEDRCFTSPPRARGPYYRGSPSSLRSIGSSPHKKYHLQNKSTGSTPRKKESTTTKEYPLVLLHCNLLPPSLSLPTEVRTPSRGVLQEALPPKYWRRWKLLEEKIVGSGLVRDRGVLISHPQEMYDLLEERLLESLELQRPRLRNGHFLGPDEGHASDEEAPGDGDTYTIENDDDEQDGDECPDCGHRVIHSEDTHRRWVIKTYAANGLMKAGAWAAAWREMEKVDVEVGLWLPSSVRRDLEHKLVELEQSAVEESLPVQEEDKPTFALKDEIPPTQDEIDGLAETKILEQFEQKLGLSGDSSSDHRSSPSANKHMNYRASTEDLDIRTLLINYLTLLASDKRNVAIGILSLLVLLLAIGGAQSSASVRHPHGTVKFASALLEGGDAPTVKIQNTQSALRVSITRDTDTELPTIMTSVENKHEASSISHSSTILTSKETNLPSGSSMDIEKLEVDIAEEREQDQNLLVLVPAV